MKHNVHQMTELIAEAHNALEVELEQLEPTLRTGDLGQLETQLQVVSRRVLERLIEGVLAVRVAALPAEQVMCGQCGQPMRQVERARRRALVGLVGDFVMRRPYWHCAPCHHGEAPVDAQLGLGPGSLAPVLQRVVCRGGITEAFEESREVVSESLGLTLDGEAMRGTTEGIGQVADVELRTAIARAQQGCAAEQIWPATHRVTCPMCCWWR